MFFELTKDLAQKTDKMVFDMLDKNGATGCRSKEALTALGLELNMESNRVIGISETAYILRNIKTGDEIDRRTITIKGLGEFSCE